MSLALVIILNAVFATAAIAAIVALAASALRRERADEVLASGARTLRRRPAPARAIRPEPARALSPRRRSVTSS